VGSICTGPFLPTSWAYNHDVKNEYNPAKAKQLLADAGWHDNDGDGFLDKDGKRFSFTVLTNQGNDQRKQPVFIIDYPREITPLCKAHRKYPDLIEKVEPMINGWEMGNGYSELNDPQLQRKLLEQQSTEGRAGGTQEPVDEDFLSAIEYGMPPTAGMGLGIDRMVMLLTDQPTIKDVILWPQMKNREEKK
jgi:lysyl-tRNA synthetase class II